MSKEALLLIDIQDIYFTPGPLFLHNPCEAADKASILLDKFRKENKTVIHVQHNFKMFPGIHKKVKPLEGEKIILKDYPSSFLGTDLREYLLENDVDSLVIAGMMSHMCVDTTTRACQDFGYDVTLIEDACTTKDLKFRGKTLPAETVHQAFMASLDGKFAKVMSLEEYTWGKDLR